MSTWNATEGYLVHGYVNDMLNMTEHVERLGYAMLVHLEIVDQDRYTAAVKEFSKLLAHTLAHARQILAEAKKAGVF